MHNLEGADLDYAFFSLKIDHAMTTFKSDQGSFLRFICKSFLYLWFFMKSNAPLTRNGWLIIPIDKPGDVSLLDSWKQDF